MAEQTSRDSLKTRKTLQVGDKSYQYYSLEQAASELGDISRLPFTLRILLENLLRHEDGVAVNVEDIKGLVDWLKEKRSSREIAYHPARVLMQDFTGVPAVVDLAAMRDAIQSMGGDPEKINPLSPVDLVIDHSVAVDYAGAQNAFDLNVKLEFERNKERYEFLKWGQSGFQNFRAVPPGTGICHQVNLEYLAQVAWTDGDTIFPDTLVGTDSHTTMINGLSVLGWGVGGIEAEAAMLGQPVSMLIPEVVGMNLTGHMVEGITATDVVLTIVQMLREQGVVGKFVEFFGSGLTALSLPDRATIANMAPEYGATCGFFPIDDETIKYLKLSARPDDVVDRVEAYAKAQGLWNTGQEQDYSAVLSLDISTVEPSISGPKRPQDKILLRAAKAAFEKSVVELSGDEEACNKLQCPVKDENFTLGHGDIVIAAITSCTNTSNPSVMLAAGLLARNALAKGLTVKPWVKTSLAPGSQVVSEYLKSADLQAPLDALGFNVVGYGCTTCIGNSGPLSQAITETIEQKDLVVTSVLSGNRNFEGRISPHVRANYLASPPLVVAYALVGSMRVDVRTESLGNDSEGQPVYLKDIWPTNEEVQSVVAEHLTAETFSSRYANVSEGPLAWQQVKQAEGQTYDWDADSTYIRNPPYFEGMSQNIAPIDDVVGARPLAVLGDSVTTDHISPAGAIKEDGPAGDYLKENGVVLKDFNSFGSRRGNHEVMMRGTFANIRLQNKMLPGSSGGVTKIMPSGKETSIYEAAMHYQQEGTPLVIVAGKEYGTGSSRDWAAKGTRLLGVKAVIVESFERIHRSNLVGMGVLPFQFKAGDSCESLQLDGSELFDITGIADVQPLKDMPCTITRSNGDKQTVTLQCRIDTMNELEYYRNGGILHYVLRNLIS
jgi:aconitate hydratase